MSVKNEQLFTPFKPPNLSLSRAYPSICQQKRRLHSTPIILQHNKYNQSISNNLIRIQQLFNFANDLECKGTRNNSLFAQLLTNYLSRFLYDKNLLLLLFILPFYDDLKQTNRVIVNEKIL